jgi:hypothetical protein
MNRSIYISIKLTWGKNDILYTTVRQFKPSKKLAHFLICDVCACKLISVNASCIQNKSIKRVLRFFACVIGVNLNI